MRPNELWMEGLAAFREEQTIDFRALEDLFAIVGPTGAGKTTILDGISLALFGELPRANQHQRKDFITLGASEVKVRLDFTAGGGEYRVARKLPRSRSQTITLHVRQGGEWVPEPEVLDGSVTDVNRRIEAILGFDYDAFTKAVVLPQGDFAQFLRGAADERGKLLSRLLDCEKYERAGAIARDRAKDAEREGAIRTQVLERDWADATEERRAGFAQQAGLLREKEATLRALLLETESAAMRAVELRARTAALYVRESKVSEAACEIDQLLQDHAALDEEEKSTVEAVKTAVGALGEAKDAFAGTERALAAAIEASGDESRLARLQTAVDTLQQADRDLTSLEAQKNAAEEAGRKANEDLAAATGASQLAAEAQAAGSTAHEEARQKVVEVRELVRISTERTEAERALEAAREAQANVGPLVDAAREEQQSAASAHREAERIHAELQTAHSSQALRSALAEGEPCPVCEQLVTALPGPGPGHEALATAARAVTKTKQALDSALREERDMEMAAARVQSSLEQAEARHAHLPAAGAPPAPDAFPLAEQAVRVAMTALDKATRAVRAAEGQVRERTAAEATATATLNGIVTQVRTLTERVQVARRTLAETFGKEDATAVAARISAAQERLRALRQAEADQRKAVDTQSMALAAATSARSAHEAVARKLGDRLVALRTRLAEELEAEVPAIATTAAGVQDGTEREVSRAVELTRLASFCGERADDLMARAVSAESDASELEQRATARLAEIELDVPEGDENESVMHRTLAALRRWIQARGEAAAQAEAEAATLTRRIEQRKEHEAQIAELTTTADRHGRLGQELRSDRFIKFVLEESFQELALRASEELRRVSAGRYSLKARGYDFQVVDHANADECRSVVTLSGGESFLASLSLALAFAGSIRDLAGDALGARLESVFIDEGFGSLDPDVLDVVADGLERVQEDRRQVGIITHVPSLAARIPSGLRVEPGPSGSNVFPR